MRLSVQGERATLSKTCLVLCLSWCAILQLPNCFGLFSLCSAAQSVHAGRPFERQAKTAGTASNDLALPLVPLPQVNKPDWVVWMVAFLATMLLGVFRGVLSAVAVALVLVIYKSAFPRIGV